MATSPRNELVIDSLVTFAQFDGGWVWSENTPDASVVIDSSHKTFDALQDAVGDYFEDQGIDLSESVDPAEAHYSKQIRVSDNEFQIRKYKFGAPDPIQAVTNV